MKNLSLLLLGVITLSTLCVSSSMADGLNQDYAKAVVNRIFNALDCDLDGTVEPAEVDDHIAQLWHPIDRDQSRSLSAKEYAMVHRELAEPGAKSLFADADANDDGQVGVDEFRAHIKRLILLIDGDGDREVSRADVGLKPWPVPKSRRFGFAPRPGDKS